MRWHFQELLRCAFNCKVRCYNLNTQIGGVKFSCPSSLSERKPRWLPTDGIPYDLSITCSTYD